MRLVSTVTSTRSCRAATSRISPLMEICIEGHARWSLTDALKIARFRSVDLAHAAPLGELTASRNIRIVNFVTNQLPKWRRALENAGASPEVVEGVLRELSETYVGWQENSFPGLLGNVVAGRIANRLDLGGTNCVVDAACASSLAVTNPMSRRPCRAIDSAPSTCFKPVTLVRSSAIPSTSQTT